MKPSIEEVQRRLNLPVSSRHVHDWRLKSGPRPGRGKDKMVVEYQCHIPGCGMKKVEPIPRW